MKLFLKLACASLFFLSCGSKPASTEEKISANDTLQNSTPKINLTPGTVIPKITCDEDGRFSYALYLPKNYNEKENWPLLILFDAHAAGTLPLEKYKNTSDKFGYVLACSNESKNGIAQGLYADIKIAMQNDLTKKIKVDLKRIYLGGFSGGARVAINLTVGDPSIAGVIANSAGFEPSRANLRNEMAFVGIAGNEDFNLREQSSTDKSLDAYLFPHYLIEFDGKHEWAPEESMEQAFLFLDCVAKKNSLSIKNENNLKTFFAEDGAKLISLKKETERFLQLKKISKYYSGIFDTKPYESELAKLSENPSIKKWLVEKDNSETKEGILQNDYYQKVFSEDLSWWDAEVKKLNSEKKGTEKYRLNKRLLSYVSLAVYMTINSPMAQQDDFEMEKFISVYSLVEPQNPEWAYDRALLRAKQGNMKEALSFLKKAVELGFTDKERAKKQREFSALSGDPEFQKLFP